MPRRVIAIMANEAGRATTKIRQEKAKAVPRNGVALAVKTRLIGSSFFVKAVIASPVGVRTKVKGLSRSRRIGKGRHENFRNEAARVAGGRVLGRNDGLERKVAVRGIRRQAIANIRLRQAIIGKRNFVAGAGSAASGIAPFWLGLISPFFQGVRKLSKAGLLRVLPRRA